MFGLRRVDPLRVAGIAVAMFILFYVFLIAWSRLDPGAEDDLATDLGAEDSTLALVAVIFLTTLMAPVVEELFFRGFLFGACAAPWPGRWPRCSPASCSARSTSAPRRSSLFRWRCSARLLCWLYQRTGSLIPGMAVHAFNNALALGVSLEWTVGQVVTGLIAAPLAVVLIASAVAGRDA